ncbi:MAG: DUF427 domain-containing protein [Methyloligellaceae bacterium]
MESVWDYPRPPRLEPVSDALKVVFADRTIAETERGLRVLETSQPPAYYFPPEDTQMALLRPSPRQTLCEFKGWAVYWDIVIDERVSEAAAWSYPDPLSDYFPLEDYLAFYPRAVDLCSVGDETVQAQPGDFYGGWITSNIRGPFKGAPGSEGW